MPVEIPKLELTPWQNTSLVTLKMLERHQMDVQSAYQSFARTMVNPTEEQKNALQQEYIATLESEKVKWEKLGKQSDLYNTNQFLANPKKIYDEICEHKGCFTVGEYFLSCGIGTVIMKRKGKGTFFGKGTLAQGTISNFVATATIGNHALTTETGGYNDKNSKDRNKAFALQLLIEKIVKENS
jgi:hypothetical protein